MRHAMLTLAGVLALIVSSCAAVSAAELIAVEHASCPICIRFDATVARSYGRSSAGRLAPLRRIDIARSDLRDIADIRIVPTFILRDNGREVGRFEGFTDAGGFYRRVGALLARLH